MAEFQATFLESNTLMASFGETQRVVTGDYEELINQPMIEDNVLIGNKTFKQLGMDTLSVQEIEKILYLD